MTLSEKDRDDLIIYRLRQAKESSEVAKLLISYKKFPAAVNRIYYGVFYCLLAIALKYQFETSKHMQLIGWFNKNFIATGIIETKFGKIIRKSYEYRKSGDYDSFVEFEEGDILLLYDEMNEFLMRIEKFLS